jgi:hypothetical protein
MDLFTQENVISIGKVAVADTTSETTTAVLDMQGFDEATFIVQFADVDAAAVLTFTVKENTASSTSSPTPTAVTLTAETGSGAISSGTDVFTESGGNLDNKLVVINVAKNAMTKRYLFLSITVADESYELASITSIKSRPRVKPVTQSSDVLSLATAAS